MIGQIRIILIYILLYFVLTVMGEKMPVVIMRENMINGNNTNRLRVSGFIVDSFYNALKSLVTL